MLIWSTVLCTLAWAEGNDKPYPAICGRIEHGRVDAKRKWVGCPRDTASICDHLHTTSGAQPGLGQARGARCAAKGASPRIQCIHGCQSSVDNPRLSLDSSGWTRQTPNHSILNPFCARLEHPTSVGPEGGNSGSQVITTDGLN